MSWLDTVDNNIFLKLLYPGDPPSLVGVRLHRVVLHQDGPQISLDFDLNEYPENPPEKWKVGKFNTVSLQIAGFGVPSLSLQGWATNNIGELSFQPTEEGILIRFEADVCKLEACVEYLRVVSATGYIDELRRQERDEA